MHHRVLAWIGSSLLGVTIGMSAHGCADDEDSGACNVDAQSGCDEGLVCRQSADGGPDCFCSTDMQTGCADANQDCYDVADGDPACFCSVDRQTGCPDGLACEVIVDATGPEGIAADCFPPVTLGGRVIDLATGAPVEAARVVARDANNAAVSGIAVTDSEGYYELMVPTPRTSDGALAANPVTLRADAAGYVTFPRPPRSAVPVDPGMASGDPLFLQSSATDIALIALPDDTGLGTVTGTVNADRPRGTVVVAGGTQADGGGVTGIADFDGTYTVFNVPAGNVAVRGYKAGLQLEGNTADVPAGGIAEGVNLETLGLATAVVSGKVEIVNPGDGDDTSVILVVEETFDSVFKSGEAPPGLRVGQVRGDFRFEGVPDGNYVALAAFENDFLVRDPDTAIGGTAIVRLTVSGGDTPLTQSFKVTGSLDVVSPDREEVVTGTPTFIWGDDSGEDHYEIVVYDAFGNLVWEDLAIPGVSGSATVEVPYGGPALEPGTLYQFRATSIKNGGTPLAQTEDLRGVFVAG
jgi:hypothetical protein